jgi:hypothetical protein
MDISMTAVNASPKKTFAYSEASGIQEGIPAKADTYV